jgi:hypothetical protein
MRLWLFYASRDSRSVIQHHDTTLNIPKNAKNKRLKPMACPWYQSEQQLFLLVLCSSASQATHPIAGSYGCGSPRHNSQLSSGERSRMKKLMFIAAMAFVMVTLSATAQVTGPNVLRGVSDQLSAAGGYRVELSDDALHVKDAATGSELLSLRQTNAQQVTISGTVAHLGSLAPALRNRIMQEIALFNFSSSVGTLHVDEKTGEVTMQHNLNPRVVPVAAIAQVATRFGDSVIRQSQALAQ